MCLVKYALALLPAASGALSCLLPITGACAYALSKSGRLNAAALIAAVPASFKKSLLVSQFIH